MLLFINFLKKYNFLFLFILLQIFSFFLTFKYNIFHQEYIDELFCNINGFYSNKINKIKAYFNLKKENISLIKENSQLKSMLYGTLKIDTIKIKKIQDSIRPYQQYEFISAQVINNQLIYKDNFYYINRGKQYGIKPDMGVISYNGIAGQIYEVFNNYSKVMSLLNSQIHINSCIKNTKYYGVLIWIRDDFRIMHMYDIPKYVNVNIGDTLETANSLIFPEGLPIGSVFKKKIDIKTGNWDLSIKLFEDMLQLYNINVVRKINYFKSKKNIIIKND